MTVEPWKPEDVAEYAQDVLEQWFTGYTDFMEDGHQRKVILTLREDGDVGYRVYDATPMVDGVADHDKVERFKITITAEKFDG
jgi:hypothetical protein